MKNTKAIRIGLITSLILYVISYTFLSLEITVFKHESFKGLYASINLILIFFFVLSICIFSGMLAKRLNRSVLGYSLGTFLYCIPPIVLLFLKEKQENIDDTGVPTNNEELSELEKLQYEMINSQQKAHAARKKAESSMDEFSSGVKTILAEQKNQRTASFVVILHEMMKPHNSNELYGDLIARLGVPFREGEALTLLSYGEQINPDFTMAMTFLTMQGPAFNINVSESDISECSFNDKILGEGILLWG